MAEEKPDWMGVALQAPERIWLPVQVLTPVVRVTEGLGCWYAAQSNESVFPL